MEHNCIAVIEIVSVFKCGDECFCMQIVLNYISHASWSDEC